MKLKSGLPAVHKMPSDFGKALQQSPRDIELWNDLTDLGRNEFICWVISGKQQSTREKRITRAIEELHEGKRRPCCWIGCVHRTDKVPSKSQRGILGLK